MDLIAAELTADLGGSIRDVSSGWEENRLHPQTERDITLL